MGLKICKSTTANIAFMPLGRDQYRPSTFVILLTFSNLAVLIILKSYGQASCGNSNSPTAQMLGRWLQWPALVPKTNIGTCPPLTSNH